MNIRKSLLLSLGVLIAGASQGQKNNETNAALEFGNAQKAMSQGDVEGQKKALIKAKEYIDLAAVHVDTKESQKTLWLVGDIYSSIMILGTMQGDTSLLKLIGENAMDHAYDALKKGYPLGKKYKSNIVSTVNGLQIQFSQFGGMMYNSNQFAMAAEIYDLQAKFADAISTIDTVAIYNSAISYNQAKMFAEAADRFEKLVALDRDVIENAVSASQAYRELEQYDKASTILTKVNANHPNNQRLLTEMVNLNLAKGDTEAAEKTLNDAIKQDPNNPLLYYVIGSIYMDLKRKEDAEKALLKALELKPDYPDVQYQLGVHLYYWSEEIYVELNNLLKNDPKMEAMTALLTQKRLDAIKYLEMYLPSDPNNKNVIEALKITYHKSGNAEKAKEYKDRLDKLN